MFDDQKDAAVKSSSDFINPASSQFNDSSGDGRKKIIIILSLGLGLLIIVALAWWLLTSFGKSQSHKELVPEAGEDITEVSDTADSVTYLDKLEDSIYKRDEIVNQKGLEYLAFGDFYNFETPKDREINFKNYALPMNVKLDVANYHEISRKLNLDQQLDLLNEKGFAVFNNPWMGEGADFYDLINALDNRQIPLFISADFISYYYQNILKASFKEIEEVVFYESLWNINKELYNIARIRYESHFSELGDVNDPVLEAERLASAYFAVSLELLKPKEDQIENSNRFDSGIFSEKDRGKYSFQVPPYLYDDVLRELDLIKNARDRSKSPVLLYDREYSNFQVPREYRANARLNNFYLAAAWLNSTFPLNYRDADCPDCLLDRDDWRVNFIAASYIAHDFSMSQDLKNEWARVYKTLSFFKGLRDSWDHIDYRQSFEDLFGKEGDIKQIFAENNLQAEKNAEDLRAKILARQTLPIQGAYDLDLAEGKRFAGLQFLADFYWPNDFILSSLRYPKVGSYQGSTKPLNYNVTACRYKGANERCQGSAQDIFKLIHPDWQNEYYNENANYLGYNKAITDLRPVLDKVLQFNLNNYWSSLYLWQNVLASSKSNLPNYLQSSEWEQRVNNSALAAFVDMQLPMDRLTLRAKTTVSANLSQGYNSVDYAFIEPNIAFFDRAIAQNLMIIDMLEVLKVGSRPVLAINYLREADQQLLELRDLALKQIRGEDFDSQDNQMIRDFARKYIVDQSGDKSLVWYNESLDSRVRQVISPPKLLILAHPVGDKVLFAVGPIFNYVETK